MFVLLSVVAFPAVLLLLAVTSALFAGTLTCGSLLALLSRRGRRFLHRLLSPSIDRLMCMPALQQVVYATCPRSLLLQSLISSLLPQNIWAKLAVAVSLDAIGSSSYLLPGLGEASDLVWGPTQAMIVKALYEGDVPPYAHYISAVEEILPFTDVLPSATLLWLRAYSGSIVCGHT